MSRRGLTISRSDPPSINTVLGLVDDATQNLSDAGMLPDSAITYAAENANTVFAGPDGTVKTKGTPSFRSLVAGDIPSLDASKITTGLLALAYGGTHTNLSGTGGIYQVLQQMSAGADVTVGQLAVASLSDYVGWTSFTPTRTAATGTWTAGTESGRYRIIGKTMHIQYSIYGSTLSAGTATISITIPASKVLAQILRAIVSIRDNGTYGVGALSVVGGSTVLTFSATGAFGAWAGGGTNNDVAFEMAFEIQ